MGFLSNLFGRKVPSIPDITLNELDTHVDQQSLPQSLQQPPMDLHAEAASALQRASDSFERQIADPTMDECTRTTAIAMRDKIMQEGPRESVVIKYKHYRDPKTGLPVAVMYSTEEELLKWRMQFGLLEAQECTF
jgi:hypothetical protein